MPLSQPSRIEDVTVAVTKRCNSRCSMCNQWQNRHIEDLSPEKFGTLFSRPEFQHIARLNITGGEPFLRNDLGEVTDCLIAGRQRLQSLFISTNGTLPSQCQSWITKLHKTYPSLDTTVTVSIDGDRETNKMVRGIDSYEAALKSLKVCREVSSDIHTMISTTLTPINCSPDTLLHLKELAEKTNSAFSFRLASINPSYYKNAGAQLQLSPAQIKDIIEFSRQFYPENPFLQAQAYFLETGEMPLMEKNGTLVCRAGGKFVFIDAEGIIHPCINSSRNLGDCMTGLNKPTPLADLGQYERCVCCTECTFYPMYYAQE